MKKELKKQIKHDELREGIGHAAGWLGAHRDEARVTAIAVAVLLLAAIGFGSYRSHRQASAERAFDDALEIFHGPVAGQPDAAQAGGTIYPSRGRQVPEGGGGLRRGRAEARVHRPRRPRALLRRARQAGARAEPARGGRARTSWPRRATRS